MFRVDVGGMRGNSHLPTNHSSINQVSASSPRPLAGCQILPFETSNQRMTQVVFSAQLLNRISSLWYLGMFCMFVFVGGSKKEIVYSVSLRRKIARIILGLKGEFILQFSGGVTRMEIIKIT